MTVRFTKHSEVLRRRRNNGEEELFRRLEESLKAAEHDVHLLRQIIERI